MSGYSIKVPPLSRKNIRAFTEEVRKSLKINKPYFPVMEILEFVLPKTIDGFVLEIGTEEEMQDCHGLTYPDKNRIILREDVYNRAQDGHGFERLTATHELAHLLIHKNLNIQLARTTESLRAFEDSEWQANCFAGEMLISHQFINQCRSEDDIMKMFGVSRSAARTQLNAFRKDGIVKW